MPDAGRVAKDEHTRLQNDSSFVLEGIFTLKKKNDENEEQVFTSLPPLAEG